MNFILKKLNFIEGQRCSANLRDQNGKLDITVDNRMI